MKPSKIPSLAAHTLQQATSGNLAAIDEILLGIEPGIYNPAVRMLGNRDDAADATQEILLKVLTHLGSFRSEAAFSIWVFQVAKNHLLTTATRAREHPEISLESMQERLGQGLEFHAQQTPVFGGGQSLLPEDKAEARQVALACTQNMLMTLDREHRLAYVLDTVFALPGKEAAEVAGVTPEAYRQRLSRAHAKLNPFAQATCGLANVDTACRCERQLPATRHLRSTGRSSLSVIAIHRAERDEAERHFDALVRMSDAAALFRAHPEYQAPETLRGAIRAVLRSEGYWPQERPLH
jgi:RNA polymerase sigma factor (sigma-70 family)